MIRLQVPADSAAQEWEIADSKARQAMAEVRELAPTVTHFGALAQRYSDDPDSRWRGGVVGWIADQADADPHSTLDPAVLQAARSIATRGGVEGPVRGKDALYVVRLVDTDPGRSRSFEELADGIRQGLRQQRLTEMEHEFKTGLLGRTALTVREQTLAAIDPLSPPAPADPLQPPALPGDRE